MLKFQLEASSAFQAGGADASSTSMMASSGILKNSQVRSRPPPPTTPIGGRPPTGVSRRGSPVLAPLNDKWKWPSGESKQIHRGPLHIAHHRKQLTRSATCWFANRSLHFNDAAASTTATTTIPLLAETTTSSHRARRSPSTARSTAVAPIQYLAPLQ
ncbi:hypothetical protein QR680_011293 [Steinernema hermaphroditum]|uniref:Uncharacterized protein n=1 Tax=Steinernema hermaphroditum TaxID=289476 RepID=A0AA39ITA1_9BILA|nr:hypothetical protein QR680_011293 [Steinernema hermaphroditum]